MKKELRRKQLRKRWITLAVIAVLVIAAGVFLGMRKHAADEADLLQAQQMMKTLDSEATSLKTEAAAAKEEADRIAAEEAARAQAEAEAAAAWEAERANFAVQPGVPCGSDTMSDEKVVYLTLDDGPSENTITALEILDSYGIKATFFVTNQNPEYAYLIKEAYDKGHTIGLHTYSHNYASIYSSVDAYYADLDMIGQMVAEQIGYVPCFIRFPGGASNYISHDYCNGIMSVLTQDVLTRGYQYFDWNASSGDGGSVTDPFQLAGQAANCDATNVVLLSHDAVGKESTMVALPMIIEYYLDQGYVFKPLSRDSYTAHHGVQN